MKTSLIYKHSKSVATILCVGALLIGRNLYSAAQNVTKTADTAAETKHIHGTRPNGKSVNQPYKHNGPLYKDVRVESLSIFPDTLTTDEQTTQPFHYKVTLNTPDNDASRPVTIIMRPIFPDGGLGNGYTWTVAIPPGKLFWSFPGKAIHPPTSASGEPLPTGTYLLEAFQKSEPFWTAPSHKYATLNIVAPGKRAGDPTGVNIAPIAIPPKFTPIADLTIKTNHIHGGDTFQFAVLMERNLGYDKAPVVKLNGKITSTNPSTGAVTILRTFSRDLPPANQYQDGDTFSLDANTDTTTPTPLAAGSYMLTLQRDDKQTPEYSRPLIIE